jgi:hypothetical protein
MDLDHDIVLRGTCGINVIVWVEEHMALDVGDFQR